MIITRNDYYLYYCPSTKTSRFSVRRVVRVGGRSSHSHNTRIVTTSGPPVKNGEFTLYTIVLT